jgi:hypothetical protein
LKLLVDHNLSPKLARALHALFEPEHTIQVLREKFPSDVEDVDWIGTLDREGGWVVVTKDLRIRTRPHERAALDRSKVVYSFLGRSWRNFPIHETAARLIRLIPKIAQQTDLADRGRFDLPINAGSKLRPHRD